MPNREPKLAEMALSHRCGGCGYDLSSIERAAQAEEAAGRARGFCVVTCPECGKRWHISAVWLFGDLGARQSVQVDAETSQAVEVKSSTVAWILVLVGVILGCIDAAIIGRPEPDVLTACYMLAILAGLCLAILARVFGRFDLGRPSLVKFGFDSEGVWLMGQRTESEAIARRGDWLVEMTSLDGRLAGVFIWERPVVAGMRPTRLVMQATLQCPREMVEETQDRIVMALGLATPHGGS